MKTRIFITATILILLSSSVLFAGNFRLLPEENINDIPFNTSKVVKAYKHQQAMKATFSQADESFVNDIPFDTWEVVACYRSDSAMQVTFNMPEEKNIEDFPFSLYEVLKNTPVFEADINTKTLKLY